MWRRPNESAKSGSDSSASNPVAPAAANIGEVSPPPSPVSYTAPVQSSPSPVTVQAPVASRTDSRIPSGIKINGQITGNVDLFIDGTVKGSIRLSGARLTVGPQGQVEADLEAAEIFVEGVVTGNIKAADKAHFGPASRTKGSVLAPRIGIQEGARLSGKVDMTAPAATPVGLKVATPAATVAPIASPRPSITEPPATSSATSTASVLVSTEQRQTKAPAPVGAATEK